MSGHEKEIARDRKSKNYANKLKELDGCYRTKVNSKAFAIPSLAASVSII